MKKIWILSLVLSACGGSHDPVAQSEPAIHVSPTPEAKSSSLIVGNWIDSTGNTLQIKENFTAISNTQKLTWSFDSDSNILFDLGAIQIDKCSYQVISKGSLVTAPIISFNLSCQISGQLSYTKSDL